MKTGCRMNEFTVRIWRCEECGEIHLDCPELEELNDPEWAHENVQDALLNLHDSLWAKGLLDI